MNKQRQSGFSHIIIVVIILSLAVISLLGFVFWQNFMQPKTINDIKVPANDKLAIKNAELLELKETITGLTITYPKYYSVIESKYSQSDDHCTPYFNYMVFSNKDDASNSNVSFGFASAESIKNMDDMCMDADNISDTDYNGLKQAFEQNKDYATRGYAGSEYTAEYDTTMVKPTKINSRNWYIESYKDSRGMVRRYTTFFDDTQIDAYIAISYGDNAEKAADILFSEFNIK